MDAKRVKETRKALNLTQSDFAKKLGVSKRTVIAYEHGSIIPKTKTDILKDLYDQTFNKPQEASINNQESIKLVPLVGHRATAGFLSGWGDDNYLEELPKIPWEVDKEYKGNYLCFEVEGDSMNNSNPTEAILDKDILLCREVQKHHWKNKIHINSWDFVIAHREKGIVVKRIIKHDIEKGEITLHSLNSMYEDYMVNLNNVLALFNIVGVKRSRRR